MARKRIYIATRSGEHIGTFDTRAEAEAAIKVDEKRTREFAARGWFTWRDNPPSFFWDIRIR